MPNFGIQIGIGISTSYAAGGLGTILNPLSLSPLIWLDASDAATLYDATTGGALVAADGTIARWEDKSGNARHATQATLGARPLKKAAMLNGLPVVKFDGVDDLLNHPLSVVGNHTLFMVVRSAETGTNPKVFFSGAAPNDPLNCTIREDVTPTWGTFRSVGAITSGQSLRGGLRIISHSATASNGSFSQNGVSSSYTAGGFYQDGRNRQAIGSSLSGAGAEWAACDIAEILVFPLLSAGDRLAVEGYLRTKWAAY